MSSKTDLFHSLDAEDDRIWLRLVLIFPARERQFFIDEYEPVPYIIQKMEEEFEQ